MNPNCIHCKHLRNCEQVNMFVATLSVSGSHAKQDDPMKSKMVKEEIFGSQTSGYDYSSGLGVHVVSL